MCKNSCAAKLVTTAATISIALCENLNIDQQNVLANFFLLVGQNVLTIIAENECIENAQKK